jgi:predicted dehydrogenase
MKTIGVGVIGASVSNPGWANIAHLPAIEALPTFELKAIATSNRASADATAKALDVEGYDSVAALAADPAVDLAVVAIKVSHHLSASLAVLDAGKMIFTEWPLGRSLAEAELIADRAESTGVRNVIGLQARYSPAIKRARELVAEGYVGRVLSSNLVASGMIWGDQVSSSQTYLLDVDSGAGIISVPLMHALEAVCYVLSEFDTVDAVGAVRRPSVSIEGGDQVHAATAPDHVSLSGKLRDGTIV